MSRLLLVVPCFNEASRFTPAPFLAAVQALPQLRLCFVDDGSTDDTAAVLHALQRQAPERVEILTLDRNSGKAEAVRRGLLQACAPGRVAAPDLCGFWDADLSAPLTELPLMLAEFDRVPSRRWIWGIRLRSLGRDITRGSLRHYLGRAFATATSVAIGLGTYDTQCGAKLFRVDDLLCEVLGEPFLSRWVFDVEMLSRADRLARSMGGGGAATFVHEHPLTQWHHRGGSKVRASDFVRALRELLAIRRDAHLWHRQPRAGTSVPAKVTVSV
ncbi:MAG: glycosyltransferase [Gemmatimonadota bacterium]